ncbi:hypothetical protein [Opitutus sp. ER46]|uniref:hypothetical protein n=1 Tax=Opitutus sp. ER46 TaxID=2161864 RepID=UPI000D30ECEB|nr:hypothetical protein [Opitutus sp. ER46]PTX98461.1 hypothetical protein DB354_04120 [Opitutus sp. ER46]
MKLRSCTSLLLAAAALLLSLPAISQPAHAEQAAAESAPAGKLIPVGEKDAAWAAKERKSYPLHTCVVSDEKLGSMGKADEYIYRVEGQPDRLVVFCCSGCEEDFMKEPAKYLAKIDAAKAKGGSSAPKSAQAPVAGGCCQ